MKKRKCIFKVYNSTFSVFPRSRKHQSSLGTLAGSIYYFIKTPSLFWVRSLSFICPIMSFLTNYYSLPTLILLEQSKARGIFSCYFLHIYNKWMIIKRVFPPFKKSLISIIQFTLRTYLQKVGSKFKSLLKYINIVFKVGTHSSFSLFLLTKVKFWLRNEISSTEIFGGEIWFVLLKKISAKFLHCLFFKDTDRYQIRQSKHNKHCHECILLFRSFTFLHSSPLVMCLVPILNVYIVEVMLC